jgi:hypothetical protein
MESKGYQLVEPPFAEAFAITQVDTRIYVSVLCWLVDTIGARQELQGLPISLELIVATYTGSYPCMALHYQDPDSTADVSPLVEMWSEELVNGASFSTYFDYVTTHSNRITEFIQHYQAACEAYHARPSADRDEVQESPGSEKGAAKKEPTTGISSSRKHSAN